jgi:hypothetical protein
MLGYEEGYECRRTIMADENLRNNETNDVCGRCGPPVGYRVKF